MYPVFDTLIKQGWPVSHLEAPFDPRMHVFENEASIQVLGVKYRKLEKSLPDMVNRMVEVGQLSRSDL